MGYIWCVLIDHDHKPTFGDLISEWVSDGDSIHQLKLKLKKGNNEEDFYGPPANRIQIRRCKSPKLSLKVSLNHLKEILSNIKFSDGDDSDVQLLSAGQRYAELGLKDDELLLVAVP